jgi:transposase-like protein
MKKQRRLLRLRVVRAAHEPKLSQSQVARRAGMGTFRYWQIENGEGPAVTDTEKRVIADVLGVRVAEIEWPDAEPVERERAS